MARILSIVLLGLIGLGGMFCPQLGAQESMNRYLEIPADLNTTEKDLTRQSTSDSASIVLNELELKDMEMSDVLKLIAQKSGLNIIAGQGVTGRVTIYLKDVDAREALRIILESNHLAFQEEGSILRVMTAQDFEVKYGYRFGEKVQTRIIQLQHTIPSDILSVVAPLKSQVGKVIGEDKSNSIILMDATSKLDAMEALIKQIDVPLKTEVFELSYARAEELSQHITSVLNPTIGRMRSDSRSNKIIVTDTEAKIQEVAKVIKAFDQKEKEVLVEAKIVQIVLNDEHKMGVDWEAIVSDFHSLNLSSKFDAQKQASKKGRLSVGTITNDDYEVLLEALDTVGKTNILSNPRITTVNNREAKILVGSTEPYVTTTTTTPASGPATTSENINFIDVGVKIFVTPTIHPDSYITMKIKPEVSSVARTIKTSTNNTVPVVETSEAETTVSVKDGVTIVIGGLIKDEKIDSIKKIPILGDLPILGFAFRNQNKLIRKTEMVIFLTPRIITSDVPSAMVSGESAQELKRTDESLPVR